MLCTRGFESHPRRILFFLNFFLNFLNSPLLFQWWDTEGQELKKVQLKGTYGKFVKFSPDFTTFVTIDNAGMLYVLTAMQGSEE